jgi:aspartate/methionine/tyrosine aminotransferase
MENSSAAIASGHGLPAHPNASARVRLDGFAKDFGLAGWRVGVLHSRNTAVVSAVRAMAHQCEASTLTLGVIERILCNTDAVADYLKAHRRTLRVACAEVTSALRTANIAYFEPDAGVFIVVDLRPFLLDQSFATETRLYHALLDRAGVNLTPGQSMNCAVPGFFRICFAYNSANVTRGAVASVIAVLEYLRMEHKYIDM